MTLSDETSSMNLDEWVAFLEPQPEHPDHKDATKVIPARGAAICMADEDWNKMKTALEQACKKLGRWCSYEAQSTISGVENRVEALQTNVMAKRRKHDASRDASGIHPDGSQTH